MEKLLALKNKLKFLRKAAAPVAFQGSILSPTTEARLRFRQSSGGSIIPREARRKSKDDNSFVTKEPSSPKVSCMGQVKKKKKKKLTKQESQNNRNVMIVKALPPPKEIKKPQLSSTERKTKNSKKNPYSWVSKQSAETEENRAPSRSKMRKMSSGRGTLSDFDWRAHANAAAAVVPVQSNHDDFEGLDVERESEEQKVEEEEEEEAKIEDFAEMEIRPKKEVNLWKRRATVPPPRLQV